MTRIANVTLKCRSPFIDMSRTKERDFKKRCASDLALPIFWHPFIDAVSSRTALDILEFIDINRPFGLADRKAVKKPPLLNFYKEQKKNYPNVVLLIENGEFYTTHGVDALMVIEHCGVRPTGKRAAAGVRTCGIQRSCDQLLAAGLDVVLFEQIGGKEAFPVKGCTRVYIQTLSRLQPTYYGRHVGKNIITSDIRVSIPLIGIQQDSKDVFKVAILDSVSKTCKVHAGLTKGSVMTLIKTAGVEKCFTWSTTPLFQHKYTIPAQVDFPELFIIDSLARHPCIDVEACDVKQVHMVHDKNRPRSLYPSTLFELGLLEKNSHVPSLVEHCLHNAKSFCKEKLFYWISQPPSPENATHIRTILAFLLKGGQALPKCHYINPRKFLPILHRRVLSVRTCYELKALIADVMELSKLPLFPSLFKLSCGEHSIENVSLKRFKETVRKMLAAFEDVLTDNKSEKLGPIEQWNYENLVAIHGLSFSKFSKELTTLREAFATHREDLKRISTCTVSNYSCQVDIKLSKTTNRLYIVWALGGRRCHPDADGMRRGMGLVPVTWGTKNTPLKDMYTHPELEQSYQLYNHALQRLNNAAIELLNNLAVRLDKYQQFFVVCASIVESFETLLNHARACGHNWNPATILGGSAEARKLTFKGLIPYWLPTAIPNDTIINNQLIVTGPNASGKSTFIRSVVSAALLGTCGLLVPAKSATIPTFKSFYLRICAKDDPARNKSSFQIEIEDIAMLEQEVDEWTIAGFDEAFRSTQPCVAVDLSLKTLDYMHKQRAITLFATHLVRQLVSLLPKEHFYHINNQRKLTSGACTESDAYRVALEAGLSPEFLGMARKHIDKTLETVLNMAECIIHKFCPFVTPIEVHRSQTPPFLKSSVVYLLHNADTGFYYVGESDAFSVRIEQHRLKEDRKACSAYVWKVTDKSLAKKIETLVGKQLFSSGIPLLSSNDNSHTHFGGY
jgi:DNA mismatch repair ATPase MutS